MVGIICQMRDCIYRAKMFNPFRKDPFTGGPSYGCARFGTIISPVGRPENGINTARCLYYTSRDDLKLGKEGES